MPDIALLPVIADIFGVSIDTLFSVGKESKPPKALFPCEETPAAAYDAILNTMWQGWREEDAGDFAPEARKVFSDSPDKSSGFISHTAGAVYADRNLALAYLPDAKRSLALLDSDGVVNFLLLLADKNVRAMLKYQMENPGTRFTAASVAFQTGIPEGDVADALEKLISYKLTYVQEVEDGSGEKLRVYGLLTGYRVTLMVYPLLSLAEKLSSATDDWYCFRG